MKIVYCATNIYKVGGMETSTIAKANALANIEGNQVCIVVANCNHDPVMPVDKKIQVVNLDVNYYDSKYKWRLLQTLDVLKKKHLHKRKMKDCLKTINPDIVISIGAHDKNFLPSLRTKKKQVFIREIPFVSNYKSLLAHGWYEKLSAWISRFLDYRVFIYRYDKIVLLTEEDRHLNWKNTKYSDKIAIIPYPVIICHSKRAELEKKVVVTAGRLVYQKNFSSLVRAWGMVHSKHPDWKMHIWGQGELKRSLEKQIEESNLKSSVLLMGITSDLISQFAESSIFVSTSILEGMPLVILYALSCGLPIVSYDYPTGPKDTITNGKDGFLVSAGDERKLAENICYLIEHEKERKQMGRAAMEKSKLFSMDIIMEKWMTLFKDLLIERS